VAIDQVKELMTTLKRTPKPADSALALDAAARARVVTAANASDPPFFAFGTLTASVRARPDGALVFAVYPADFPATTRPLLVLEDLPDPKSFGTLGLVYVSGSDGLQAVTLADAAADTRGQVTHALALLRTDALSARTLCPRSTIAPRYRAPRNRATRTRRSRPRRRRSATCSTANTTACKRSSRS
jgi:hypothetical protein